jgi:predicted GNAT family acetyltransferase
MRVNVLSADEFVARVIPALAAREAENNKPFGIALRLAASRENPARAVLLSVQSGERVVACAVRTPPRDIIVSRLPEGAARVVAHHFLALPAAITGVMGPEHSGREVAEVVAQGLGARAELRLRQLVYELTSVKPVAQPSGKAHAASRKEHAFVASCYAAFVQEAGITHAGDASAWAEAAIEAGRAYVWDDESPRALACSPRETPSGRSIGPVYTPPPFRRRGYATALVADLAQRILNSGKRFACLFTDASNLTANHIYETIGFRRICSFDAYTIETGD